MPLFAISDQLILGIVTAVTGLFGTIAAGIIAVYMAKISKKADTAATKVEDVKATLEETTARHGEILNKIDETATKTEKLCNNALLEAQHAAMTALKAMAAITNETGDKAAAEAAERKYLAHKHEQDSMASPPAPVPPVDTNTGPITSAELKKDILATPVKVVDEINKRKQSPPSKESS